ncbi:3-hydroxyacyl-CoA dehydrogenase family protein [Nocardia coffeae]|uniref:3-hydroxyacyl-CoA dehydrogenase family protein n=1 Tax=Nocardia coffeae TaxID=2873381 RepID=UPI001F1F30FB|nr:3-hydroxyacyl-CoA dehydrogenase family protein [Nocardia coffeae]
MISRILVVGAGAMGAQIALTAALAGYEAVLTDIDDGRLIRARSELTDLLAARVRKERLTETATQSALDRLTCTSETDRWAPTVDYVIEAAVEKLDVKRKLFAHLDGLLPEHAILASNSSGFVPSRLADATDRPDRVCNLHFFNPALIMRGVEIVRGPQTSDDTVQTSVQLAERLGKTPVVLDREIPGFLANRILNAVRDEAIALLEADIATVEAIDSICRTALGYPMGPFELMDLTGVDIGYLTKTARFEESGDPRDAPSRSVALLVERGELGRKTGRGWYDHAADGTASARPRPQE